MDAENIAIRTGLRPGDLGAVVRLHGVVYARERGFDVTFEAYVAAPLAEFARRGDQRERIWLAERGGEPVGCIAVVASTQETAQLRWFLVDPSARSAGLGRRLLTEAIAFAHTCGYDSLMLWTESALAAASRLYRSVGFRKVEDKPGRMWGVDLVQERYELKVR